MACFQFFRKLIYLWLCTVALLSILGSLGAEASVEFQLLHEFGQPQGAPFSRLVKDSAGNLYGTTYYGGSKGAGTVFKIDKSGNFSTLHDFDGGEGGANANYYESLILANDGNLYGTTDYGGSNNAGIVYKLNPSGNFSVLHSFDGGAGGSQPTTLIQGNDGNIYGTAGGGGSYGAGLIFKITLSGAFSVFYEFEGGSDGYTPQHLVQGGDKNFYGTTQGGGSSGGGTLFKLDMSGNLTVLHAFGSVTGDGDNPTGVLQTSDGSLYGATHYGGSYGAGTLFKIDPSGNFSVLHAFVGASDGENCQGGMTQGIDGYFYGTTSVGGANGYGTVFKIDNLGNFTVLHAFDAANRRGMNAPIQDSEGNLYGTTYSEIGLSRGTVYKLGPSGEFNVLHEFEAEGSGPMAGLLQARDGNFYGTTSTTLFKIDGAGNFSVLHELLGSNPYGALIQGRDGGFYGTTNQGGSICYYGVCGVFGTIFKYDLSGNYSVLHEFDVDSYQPAAGLIQVCDGSFYGTTSEGSGRGAVFKLDPSGNYNVVHGFDGGSGGGLLLAGLIQGRDGRFYGTAAVGGSYDAGVIYRLDPFGNFNVLHDFDGGEGGSNPDAGLLLARDGGFYGTTAYGGSYGYGTVYKLDAYGNFTVLHSFDSATGSTPFNGLIQSRDGSLYGTTYYGGSSDAGVVYKLDTSGNFSVIHGFDGTHGANPYAGLIQARDGSFYGTSVGGGQYGGGTVFRLIETADATATNLTSNINPSLSGKPVTFTATVNGDHPTGTVIFFDGAAKLGSSRLNPEGQAQLTTFRLSKGKHRISARYLGDSSNAASASSVLIQVVR